MTGLRNKNIEIPCGQWKRAGTTNEKPEKQMRKNAIWLVEKADIINKISGNNKSIDMFYGQRTRSDTINDRPEKQMKGGHQ